MRNGLLLALIFFSFNLFCQEHMTFRDIPINGNVDDFSNQLEKLGFKRFEYEAIYADDNVHVHQGIFLKRKCLVWVDYTRKTKTVYQIRISFDLINWEASSPWNELKSCYLDIKSIYQTKYGKGESEQYFINWTKENIT